MRHYAARRNCAFTLIELLVVIAVIAILMAILFPVFANVREKGRGASCLSNLKQIGLGIFLYAQDHDEMYPRNDGCAAPAPSPLNPNAQPGCGPAPPYGQRLNHYKWPAWILPYTKSVNIFFCPSRQKDETNWRRDGEIYNGYALNLSITGSINTLTTSRPTLRNSWLGGGLSGVQTPAETFLVMEHWFPGVWGAVYPASQSGVLVQQTVWPLAVREVWACALKVNGSVNKLAAIHSGGFNFAYCDGHAKYMSVDAFLSRTPALTDWPTPPATPNPPASRSDCARGFPDDMVWTSSAPPVWSGTWPLWGLR